MQSKTSLNFFFFVSTLNSMGGILCSTTVSEWLKMRKYFGIYYYHDTISGGVEVNNNVRNKHWKYQNKISINLVVLTSFVILYYFWLPHYIIQSWKVEFSRNLGGWGRWRGGGAVPPVSTGLPSHWRYWNIKYFNTTLVEYKVTCRNGTSSYITKDDFESLLVIGFKRKVDHCYFIFFVFKIPSLKMFLIYFLANFNVAVLIKFILLKMLQLCLKLTVKTPELRLIFLSRHMMNSVKYLRGKISRN